MKLSTSGILAAALVALFAICGASDAQTGLPSPADFGRYPAIDQLSLSPDGKHIAGLTSNDGKTVQVSVWSTDALDKPAQTLASAARTRYVGVGWLKNDRLLVQVVQPLTIGKLQTHIGKSYMTDFSGKEFKPLLPLPAATQSTSEEVDRVNAIRGGAQILDRLPLDPQNVLVIDTRVGGEGDVYKLNVYTGATNRLVRGSDKYGSEQTDLNGEIRARQSVDFEGGRIYFAQWLRLPGGDWEEHFRWYAKDREPTQVVGFDTDPNIAFVSTTRGKDKAGIYTYDIRAKKIVEPLFEHKLFEADSVVQARGVGNNGKILGFRYAGESGATYWVDPTLKGIADQLPTALAIKSETVDWIDPGTGAKAKLPVPAGARADIIDWSDDLKTVLIEKSGPSQPPAYFLLRDGKMSPLGVSRPWIDTAKLGRTSLVEYTARDGLVIPAFLTRPNASAGAGPFPTIILPHGGPWSRDELGWDPTGWTQYFASRGFVVLQPQFRGSEGWGQKLWRAGDAEWGQKMQDDLDDGAKWLIDQKLADPQRIAMMGYSYGGYAALAATIRPNGLYQCAVAGAAAGDLASMADATFRNRFQREFQSPTIRGLDALQHAREAKIPVFIYHGDHDQIVELKQSKKFVSELEAAKLPHRFLEIKEMGHTLDTWPVNAAALQLTEIEKYLKTDCGPGGI